MNKTYFMGVDVGTTTTKAIVFSVEGEAKGIGNKGYDIISPKPSWAEQDPKKIFGAVLAAVCDAIEKAGVSSQEIAAVGFSAAMHSLLAVDGKGEALTNAIIWADNRSIEQAQQLKKDNTGQELYQRSGTPIHPMSPLTKLMWLREHEPEMLNKAAKLISIKEYIFYQLFERYVVDYSMASVTGLFNLRQLNWDAKALATAGIRREQLSELVPTTHILRGMKSEYAAAMGLNADTPIVIGASDGVLANLGVGAIKPHQVAVTVGTSGAIRSLVDAPLTDPQGRTFCYPLTEKYWAIGGASNNGGIVLRWFRDRFSDREIEQAKLEGLDPYEVMIREASQVSAGAEGLICLPFLSGERAPYWDANARGVFFGIGQHHTRSHFIRAVLEGIVFSMYNIYAALRELAGETESILVSGGFARSELWRQMMADVFEQEVLLPEVYEASSFGAAILAMYAVGAIKELTEVEDMIHITQRHQPDASLCKTYGDLFPIYKRLYANLVEEFSAIADYQRRSAESQD
ncbi:MAG: gluconate kinase [Kastovskya adunca ATA6-11-RM4]|jgi:gluconokinase|nr:gluconate kinase [Kastovskya adunca ATA6-11-RM4]